MRRLRVLVTGADGFVGRHLLPPLQDAGHEVLGLNGPESLTGRPTNILDADGLFRQVRLFSPDVVIHLAAMSSVRLSWDHPATTIETNVIGTLNLWNIAVSLGIERFIYVSSSEVYGAPPQPLPVTEDHPLQPKNPYGTSKATSETLLRQLEKPARPPRLVILRPFNHLGPGQSRQFAVSDFAHQLLSPDFQGVLEVGNLNPVRDFLDVQDVVHAYCLAVEQKSLTGVYNVCSGVGRSIGSVLKDLWRLSGKGTLVIKERSDRLRPDEIPYIVGDPSRFIQDTGWAPVQSWEDTLTRILRSVSQSPAS